MLSGIQSCSAWPIADFWKEYRVVRILHGETIVYSVQVGDLSVNLW